MKSKPLLCKSTGNIYFGGFLFMLGSGLYVVVKVISVIIS